MTVGDRIKKRREELDLSQGDLARRMNISRQAVSKAELHGGNNITTDKISKFAKALGVSSAYLMGWEDDTDLTKELNIDSATQDAELLTIFHQLSATDKERLIQMAKLLL